MSILRMNCTKYLEVLIDEYLSFREHIDYVSLKLARNVDILRKLKYIFLRDILRTLYYSLIYPYLLYCCTVWGSTFLLTSIVFKFCRIKRFEFYAVFVLKTRYKRGI